MDPIEEFPGFWLESYLAVSKTLAGLDLPVILPSPKEDKITDRMVDGLPVAAQVMLDRQLANPHRVEFQILEGSIGFLLGAWAIGETFHENPDDWRFAAAMICLRQAVGQAAAASEISLSHRPPPGLN